MKLEGSAEVKRPWVARQWAGARVDDLLDEIELGGSRPELQNEVLDLALAYNFATPYTAFLAIPASELDWQSARTLSGARAYKSEILKRKPDAARVAGRAAPGGDTVAGNESQQQDLTLSLRRSDRAAPQAAPPDSHDRVLAENENALEETAAPKKKMQLGSHSQKVGEDDAGCASCALGGRGGDALAALAFAGIVMIAGFARRRRR